VHSNAKHVRSVGDVAHGDLIDIRVMDGVISGVVRGVEGEDGK
jgi:hypothetical protein